MPAIGLVGPRTDDELLSMTWPPAGELSGGRVVPGQPAKGRSSSLNCKNKDNSQPHEAIAQHQVRDAGWCYHPVIREILRWKGIYNEAFELELPDVAFCIGFTRRNCHGYFRPGHNWFGFKREIMLNEGPMLARIANQQFWQVLGTVLHELLHAWQDIHGCPAKGNYHNAQFRAKALECGLVVNERGYTEYLDGGRLFELLDVHGVADIVLPDADRFRPQPTKLKKWVCGCHPQYGVRVAIEGFSAVCLHCQQRFALAEC